MGIKREFEVDFKGVYLFVLSGSLLIYILLIMDFDIDLSKNSELYGVTPPNSPKNESMNLSRNRQVSIYKRNDSNG